MAVDRQVSDGVIMKRTIFGRFLLDVSQKYRTEFRHSLFSNHLMHLTFRFPMRFGLG